MKSTRAAINTAAALLAVLTPVLTGCTSGTKPVAATSPTALPTSTETKAVSQGFEAVPQPTLAAYLDTLRGIDPALAANDVNAWREAIHLCYQSYAGLPHDQLVAAANKAYSSDRGEPILAAAQQYLCGVKGVREEWERYTPASP